MVPIRNALLFALASLAGGRLLAKSLATRDSGVKEEVTAKGAKSAGGEEEEEEEEAVAEQTSVQSYHGGGASRRMAWRVFALGGSIALALRELSGALGASIVAFITLCTVTLVLSHWGSTGSPTKVKREATKDTSEVVSPVVDFSGTWVKDDEASDSMDEVMSAMKLNPLIRMATRLVRGLELEQTEDSFKITVFSVIKWFKIHEEYSFTGSVGKFPRRDLRKGQHRGSLTRVGDMLRLTVAWDEPLAGLGTDDFKLVSYNELHVKSSLKRHGMEALRYNIVYHRKV